MTVLWILLCLLVDLGEVISSTVLDSGKFYVPLGGSINLRCQNKTDGPFKSVVWTSNAYSPMKESTLVYDESKGQEVRYWKGSSPQVNSAYKNRIKRRSTSIQIYDVHMNDTGNYECNIIFYHTPRGEETRQRVILRAVYDIVVIGPPVIKKLQPERLLITSGETSHAYCEIRGQSPFNITWVKDDGTPVGSNVKVQDWIKIKNGVYKVRSHITFEHFYPGMVGVYRCIAHNIAGKVWKTTRLVLKEPPKITAKSTIIANPGRTIAIWCNATGTPTVKFTWTLLDREITLNEGEYFENFEVTATDNYGNYEASRLFIRHLEKGDWGAYRCEAMNEAGNDEREIVLTGFTVPEAPRRLYGTTAENAIKLQWNLSHNGGRAIQSVVIEFKESLLSDWSKLEVRKSLSSYEIMNLKSGRYYDFRVHTINKIGRSDYSEIFSIQTRTKKQLPSENANNDKQIKVLGLNVITFTAIIGGIVLLFTCIIVCACLIQQNKRLKQADRKTREAQEQKEKEKLTAKIVSEEHEMNNLYSVV